MTANTNTLHALVRIVADNKGITAGHAGFELWGESDSCRPENTCATMHCRAAGKLLKRAQALGLVYYRQHGPARLWYAKRG